MIFEEKEDCILLRVRLTPNSSSCCINGIFNGPDGEDFLKINVVSVPEKGKANKELIAFLSKLFRLSKSSFQIVGGELDRYKRIEISAEKCEIVRRLIELAGEKNDSENH